MSICRDSSFGAHRWQFARFNDAIGTRVLWLDVQFRERVSTRELKWKWWKQSIKWRQHRQKSVLKVQLPKQTSEDYNGQSGLPRGLSVPLCPASNNFTPPEWGKVLRKSLWTPHTQLTLSLNCYLLAGATDHGAPKQPDTRTVFSPRPYPTWTTHNTPQSCTSVNNSSNLHLYIGHMHIHSSVYDNFYLLYIFYYRYS